jgi:hypothetical protein
MCIPKEFLYDTMPDCMDSSDEQEIDEIYAFYSKCLLHSISDCDERLCRKDHFSCGDGTCAPWWSVIDHSNGCKNSRNAAYICETVDHIITDHAVWSGICEQTTPSLDPLTSISDCMTSLRYLLFKSQEKLANETRLISFNNIIDRCPDLIQYPELAVLSPVLKTYYNKSWIKTFYESGQNFHHQMPRKPHLFCLNGMMICNGIWMTLRRDYCMDQDDFQKLASYPYFPISHLFCQIAVERESLDRSVSKKRSFCSYYIATYSKMR